MKDTWINHSVYSLLDRIANFQIYLENFTEILAAICFLMAVGMACVKIFLQAASAREQIIKLFLTLSIYFVMLFFYPIVTKAILPLAQNLGYEIIFSSGDYTIEVPDVENSNDGNKKSFFKPSTQNFYEWVAKVSGGIFETNQYTDETGAVKEAFSINIVDRNSGRIDLNKTFKFCVAFGNACAASMPKLRITILDALIAIFMLVCFLVAIVCYIVVLINYVMCLLDYYFMIGFGILFLPLSLWDGTKQYTQGLIGNFAQILVKLMIITTVLFLSVMSLIDMLLNLYLQSQVTIGGLSLVNFNYKGQMEFGITLIFQGLLLYVMTKETTKIASVLTGGTPQLSFGEFAHAAVQGVATGGAAVGIAKKAGEVGLAVASGGTSAIASGAGALMAGGGFKEMARSVGASVGQSTMGALKSFKENAPSMAGKISSSFGAMTGMNLPGGSEGGTFTPGQVRSLLNAGGKGGGSSGSGGGGEVPSASQEGSGSQANSENNNGSSLGGGDNSPIANTSPSWSKSSRVLERGDVPNQYNGAKWQSGDAGVYGTVNNSDNSASGALMNYLTKGANISSMNAKSLMGYRMGSYQAFGGNVIKAIKQTHAEHMSGNRSGNGYLGSIMRAGGATIRESFAGLANRGNILSTNEMDPSGKLHVSAFKGGSSQFYDNYGNPTNEFDSVKRDGGIRNNILKGNLIQMSDKPFHDNYPSGPTDSDAVNFANEATKNAGGNN